MYKKETTECQVAHDPLVQSELTVVQDEINRLEKSVNELMGILRFVSRDEKVAGKDEQAKEARVNCELKHILHAFAERIESVNERIAYQLSVIEI